MPSFYRRGESSWRNIYPLFPFSHSSSKSHSWLCRSPQTQSTDSPRTEWSNVHVSSQTTVQPTLFHCLCFLSSLLFCCCSNEPKEGFPSCVTQKYLRASWKTWLKSSISPQMCAYALRVELGLQKPGTNYTWWSKSVGRGLKMTNLWVVVQRSHLKEEAKLFWSAFIRPGAT